MCKRHKRGTSEKKVEIEAANHSQKNIQTLPQLGKWVWVSGALEKDMKLKLLLQEKYLPET